MTTTTSFVYLGPAQIFEWPGDSGNFFVPGDPIELTLTEAHRLEGYGHRFSPGVHVPQTAGEPLMHGAAIEYPAQEPNLQLATDATPMPERVAHQQLNPVDVAVVAETRKQRKALQNADRDPLVNDPIVPPDPQPGAAGEPRASDPEVVQQAIEQSAEGLSGNEGVDLTAQVADVASEDADDGSDDEPKRRERSRGQH